MSETNKPDNPGVGIVGIREGGNPANEEDNFYVCLKCGQAVDMRDLGQVFHHEEPDHKPISQDS